MFSLLVASLGCDNDSGDDTGIVDPPANPAPSTRLATVGQGLLSSRYTAEVWAHGGYAYTTTWGTRVTSGTARSGNTIYIWDVRAATPVLVDSVAIAGVGTIGDVQVSADGRLLVVCTEPGPGSIQTFDLTNPVKPQLLSVFGSPKITAGVHTTEIQTVGGVLYAFLSVNRSLTHPARTMIVDLRNPAAPTEVAVIDVAGSVVHDVFVRDGLLFAAQWDNGVVIFDIGGGGRGGSPSNPVRISSVLTVGGKVHNIWWFHDPSSGGRRYLMVGEEGTGALFTSSSGSLHVVDISNIDAPREVAFFTVSGAGAHNFSVDEPTGYLYAAFYNAGVQVLDIRGDLGTCPAAQQSADGRCDLSAMGRLVATGPATSNSVYIWGVHFTSGALYASDMLNGLWKLAPRVRTS